MILEAIKAEMWDKHENPNILAKKFKVKPPQMYNYFNGVNKPGLEMLERMCEHYDLELTKKVK